MIILAPTVKDVRRIVDFQTCCTDVPYSFIILRTLSDIYELTHVKFLQLLPPPTLRS